MWTKKKNLLFEVKAEKEIKVLVKVMGTIWAIFVIVKLPMLIKSGLRIQQMDICSVFLTLTIVLKRIVST